MEKKYRGKSNLSIIQNYLDGTRPFTTIGYAGKKYIKRDIGTKWTDIKGIVWEQKESGPVRINRVADIVRSAINDICQCGQNINFGSKLDNIFFRKTGLCENCLIDYETKLRILGIYHEYEQYKLISNEIGSLTEAKDKISDVIKFFSNNSGDVQMLCNSEGFIERWKSNDNTKILEDAKKDLDAINQRVSSLTKKKNEFKKVYNSGCKKYKIKSYAKQ